MGCNCGDEARRRGEMPGGEMRTGPPDASTEMRTMSGQTSGATDIEMVEYSRQRGTQASGFAATPGQMSTASMGAAPQESRMGGGPPTPGEMPGGKM